MKGVRDMKSRKRSIIGVLTMIIVLAISAGCLFGCGSSEKDDKESDKKQSQRDTDDEDDKKLPKKIKKDDDNDDGEKSNDYELVISGFMEAYKKVDAEKMLSFVPEKLVKKKNDSALDTKYMLGFLISVQSDDIKDNGGDIDKMSYKIASKEKLDKDEVEDIKKGYKDNSNIRLDIKQAVKVELAVTIPFDGEDKTEEFEMTLAKIDDKWYILRPYLDLEVFYQ